MNKLLRKILILSILVIVTFAGNIVHAQNLQPGYYLTIAAYAKNKEAYAKAYVDHVKTLGFDAKYDFFPKKNYYFVYLKQYDDFNLSIRELYKTRKTTEFDDCWVYILKHTEVMEKALNKEVSSLNDMFAERFGSKEKEEEKSENNNIDTESEAIEIEPATAEDQKESLSEEEKAMAPVIKSNTNKEVAVVNGKHVFFSLFHGTTGKEVKGQVQVIDGSNNQLLMKYDGNKINMLKNPENGNGDLILISDVFGYKKVQNHFNYEEPIDDEEYPYVTNIGDTLVVNFELSRYRQGDIATMYNVFFFKDAAIMRPSSKYEINELVKLLKENPGMEIRIHGHTNGNAHGKIISMKEHSENFFSLSGDNKTSIGSSKKLSNERANMMKKYLVSQGINAHRIQTKAWGGKSEIHHKLSNLAHKNVRVEIEVLKE